MSDDKPAAQDESLQEDLESIGFGKSTQEIVDAAKAAQEEKPEPKESKPQEESKAEPVEEQPEDADEKKESEPVVDEKESEVSPTLSPEQLSEVLGTEVNLERLQEIKKAYDNREQWERSLKQKSMGLSFLKKYSPEQLEVIFARLQPMIAKREEVPETPDDLVEDAVKRMTELIPEEIRFTDSDDYEVKVGKDKYMPHFQKVIGAVLKNYLPELTVLRENLSNVSKEATEYQERLQQLQVANGRLVLDGFFARHPDLAPTPVNESETPVEALLRIEEAGFEHPEYDRVLKFRAAGDLMMKSQESDKPLNFDQSWEKLYGKEERQAKRAAAAQEDLKKAQQESKPEAPGETVAPNPTEELLKKLPQSHLDKVNELFK